MITLSDVFFFSPLTGNKEGCAPYKYSRTLINKTSNSKVEIACSFISGIAGPLNNFFVLGVPMFSL